jgi:DNA mismatch endonuclease, patch repair protein
MADVHSKESRSYNMSRIRSKDTKPEMLVRRFLHKNGFRYRLHVKDLPGKPDIVLPKYKTVIFIHGCFWHGHEGCSRSVLPKSNEEYWLPKLEKNVNKDRLIKQLVVDIGWNQVVVWECELKSATRVVTLQRVLKNIKGNRKNKTNILF